MIRISPGNGILRRRLGTRRIPRLNGIVRCAAALVIMASMALPNRAMASGDEGHRVIARIAAERLTPEARAEVEDLLGGPAASVMADASTWADERRRCS
jgi:hypothetical protein